MPEEFKTLQFPDTEIGQKEKIRAMTEGAKSGWRVLTETVTNDTIDASKTAKDAACMCFLCGPFCAPFLMKPTVKKGTITVTFARSEADRQEVESALEEAAREAAERRALREAEYQTDRDNASLDRLISVFKSESSDQYISETIVKVLGYYLKHDRAPMSEIPALSKCYRKGGEVFICAANGQLLRRYPIDRVRDIVKPEN